MTQTNTRAVVETGFLSAMIMVFAIIGMNVPFLGFFASILVPMTIAIVGIRHSLKWSFLSVIAAMIGISLFAGGPLVALSEAISFGVLGILIGLGFKRQWEPLRLIGVPAIALFIAFGIQVGFATYYLGIDVINLWQTMTTSSMESAISNYKAMGIDETQLAQMQANMEASFAMMGKILVGAALCGTAIITYFVIYLTNIISGRIGSKTVRVPSISEWRMPYITVHAFLVAIILNYGGQYYEWLGLVGTNLGYMTGLMLFAQGASCLWNIIASYTPVKFLRYIGMIVLFMMPMAGLVLGVLDLILDIKKRWGKSLT